VRGSRLSNSNLPISSTSPVDSIPYQAPNYSGDVIEQLKSEISLLEYKHKQLQDPNSFGLVDQAKIEADFYEYLKKIEKEIGSKACPDGQSNLWKELQFLIKNDPAKSSDHWMAFHQISEIRTPPTATLSRSPEVQIAEIEAKLEVLLKTWHDYTGTQYPE
jgi:hypothetical protein